MRAPKAKCRVSQALSSSFRQVISLLLSYGLVPVQHSQPDTATMAAFSGTEGALCLNAQLLEVDRHCCGAQRLEAAAAAAVSVTTLRS